MTIRRALSAALVLLASLAAPSSAAAASIVAIELLGESGGTPSVKLNRESVPEGKVTLYVANHATSADHNLVLVRLTSKTDPIWLRKNRVDEGKLWTMGKVSVLKPSETGEFTVTLKPGPYLVFCNMPGHYKAGMRAFFTVTKGTAAASAAP